MVAASRRGKTTKSIPGEFFSMAALNDWRKLSRMTRLIRFLPTACRSTCRDTAMPSRE